MIYAYQLILWPFTTRHSSAIFHHYLMDLLINWKNNNTPINYNTPISLVKIVNFVPIQSAHTKIIIEFNTQVDIVYCGSYIKRLLIVIEIKIDRHACLQFTVFAITILRWNGRNGHNSVAFTLTSFRRCFWLYTIMMSVLFLGMGFSDFAAVEALCRNAALCK